MLLASAFGHAGVDSAVTAGTTLAEEIILAEALEAIERGQMLEAPTRKRGVALKVRRLLDVAPVHLFLVSHLSKRKEWSPFPYGLM